LSGKPAGNRRKQDAHARATLAVSLNFLIERHKINAILREPRPQ
jgi:hypothetical protein